jgi:drug/metabolite transporter (DMT)-like permease
LTGLALALVLASAVTHATWNLMAKRAGGGVPLIWLFTALSAAVYAPVALAAALVLRPSMSWTAAGFVAGSSLLHIAYFLLLQRGYRVGDLSLVYPLARGTGPLLSTALAIALMGERPTPLAIGGAGLIALGTFGLTFGGPRAGRPSARTAIGYGLATGAFIAVYTLWDKHAVSALLIPPLVYDWCSNFGRVLMLTGMVRGRWSEVRREWRDHRREVLGVAVLSPLSYILVLTALVTTPVSYVAPAREISILIGTLMGTHLLSEGNARRRIAAASLMVAGVVALALG